MGERRLKDDVYTQLGRIAKATAHPKRLELLDVLVQGERSVEVLSEETDQPLANASQHLKVLREAHLVVTRRDGIRIFYRLADPAVFELIQVLRAVAEQQVLEF